MSRISRNFRLGMLIHAEHIVPRAVLGLKVVTMKTEGWVLHDNVYDLDFLDFI